MANTKSAKAKVREIQNKTEFNKSIKNRYRTFLKKVELNIVKGDKKEADKGSKKEGDKGKKEDKKTPTEKK